MTIDASGFQFVRQLVRERAAIVLEDGKQYLVDNRLSQLARREGLASAQEVIDRLRAAPGGPLQRKVIEAMTTTETLFFRDSKPYEALQNTILPELIRSRAGERKLQIWSGACSSGQEPYSVAMLLREHFPALAAWHVRVLATDLSTEMLARSRAGRYSQLEVNRGLPVSYRVKYFDKIGLEWQVRGDLRKMLDLRELNLAGPWNTMPPTDLVMLRNVLIYFDVETKRQILGKIRKIMRPGGFLLLGTAETTMNLDDGFELVRSDGTTYYRTRGAG
ncbi:MAG TPA: protein-glutamate O-methyltransferase CheR [Kofleriaceae bacterium]|nr:protein-glutamate O-methyltransferase CheR [Kofleriaceae bacterium]